MGLKTIIPTGTQYVLNFLIVRMEQWNTIHRLPTDVRIGSMRCYVGENYIILYIDMYTINANMMKS